MELIAQLLREQPAIATLILGGSRLSSTFPSPKKLTASLPNDLRRLKEKYSQRHQETPVKGRERVRGRDVQSHQQSALRVKDENRPVSQEEGDDLQSQQSSTDFKGRDRCQQSSMSPSIQQIESPIEEVSNKVVERSFFDAIRHGKVGALKTFLSSPSGSSFDVNTPCSSSDRKSPFPLTYGWQGLHFAAWTNNAEITKLLLGRGANPHLRNPRDQAPLHIAAFRNSMEVASLLLSHGAEVDAINTIRKRQTPLHLAALQGHYTMVCLLLDSGAQYDLENTNEQGPRDAFGLATYCGAVKVIQAFKDRGLISNSVQGAQCTWFALGMVIQRKHKEALMSLLNLSPQLDFYLYAAGEVLVRWGDFELGKTLLEEAQQLSTGPLSLERRLSGKGTIYHHAVEKDDYTLLQLVAEFDKKKNIDNTGSTDFTPLGVAIYQNNERMVKELLELGADPLKTQWQPGLREYAGVVRTCYHICAEKGSEAISHILFANKVPEARVWTLMDNRSHTIFQTAALNGHASVLRLLFQYMPDSLRKELAAENLLEESPLHLAASRGHLEAVRALLDLGANANSKNSMKSNQTPLHAASGAGKCEVVQVLLENGADINSLTSDKMSALQLAKKSNHNEVVMVLKLNGATLDESKSHSRTDQGRVQLMVFEDQCPEEFKYRDEYGMSKSQEEAHMRSSKKSGKIVQNSTRIQSSGSAPWTTVRLFISSTFEDMQAERNHVIKVVLPRLRQECLLHRVHLVEVDLRWGVTEEESQSGRAVEICMNEVDSCFIFAGLVGNRYGWVPSVPDDIKQRFEWQEGHSVTHMEILRGALKKKNNPNCHASFYLRNSELLLPSLPPSLKDLFDETDGGKRRKLEKLRKDIEALEKRFSIYRYNPSFSRIDSEGKPELSGLDEFGERFYENVMRTIEVEFPLQRREEEAVDDLTIEFQHHDQYVEQKTKNFVGRQDHLDSLFKYVQQTSSPQTPQAVFGDPGAGKSALLAFFTKDLIATGSVRQRVIYHFVGASAQSTNVPSTLLRLCKQIIKDCSLFIEVEEASTNYDTLKSQFLNILEEVGRMNSIPKLVILVDAVNQLDAATGGSASSQLDWIPLVLPHNVRMIVSCLPDSVSYSVLSGRPYPKLVIGLLSDKDRKEIIIETLGKYHKKLDDAQFRLLMEKKDTQKPLYLVIACEELRIFGIYEKVTQKIRELPVGLYGLIEQVFSRLEKDHGKQLVTNMMSLLKTSRYGLLETELLQLLQLNSAKYSSLTLGLELFLRSIGKEGRLDFFHRQIAKAVARKYLSREEVQLHYHTQLAQFYQSQVDPDNNFTFKTSSTSETAITAISELPYHLLSSGKHRELHRVLCNLNFIHRKARAGLVFDLINDFNAFNQALLSENSVPPPLFLQFKRFIQGNISIMIGYPDLIFQQAFHSPLPLVASHASEMLTSEEKQKYFKWVNQPVASESPEEGFILITASSDVNDVSWSPDQRYLVSGQKDGSVSLWNSLSGEEEAHFNLHKNRVNGCTFSPDGEYFASTAADGVLAIIKTSSRQVIFSTSLGSGVVGTCCDFGGWGNLVVGLSSGDVLLFVEKEGSFNLEARVSTLSSVGCCRFYRNPTGSSDPKPLRFLVGSGKAVILYEVNPRNNAVNKVSVFKFHSKPVKDCAWFSSGDRFASSAQDKTVVLTDISNPTKPIQVLDSHTDNVESCDIGTMKDMSEFIVSGSWDRSARLWSNQNSSYQQKGVYPGQSHFVNVVSVAPDGSLVAVGSPDHTIKIYPTNSIRSKTRAATNVQKGDLLRIHDKMLRGLSYSITKRAVVTGAWDKTVKIHKLTSEGKLNPTGTITSKAHTKRVNAVEWTPEGDFVISGGMDQLVNVLSTTDGRAILNLRRHSRNVFAIAITHDGRYVASASADHSVVIWDLEEQQDIGVLQGHSDWATALAFSPYSRRLLTGGRDGLIKVWNTETGEEIETMKGHTKSILQLRYSPDGKLIASASDDKTLTIWDAHQMKLLHTLHGHTNEVTCCAFFKGRNDLLVSGSSDNSVRVWNTQTGTQEWLCFIEGGVISLDTTEDNLIILGDSVGCLRVWEPHNIL